MAVPTHSAVTGTPLHIQRATGETAGQTDSAPASVERVLTSSGKPLEPALRRDMERRFGYDFSQVRVHADPEAAQSSQAVSAHAYTVGHHIVFGNGSYAPNTMVGRRLVAHELAHVVQQSKAGLTQNTGPSLNPELRLQRQLCSRANDRIVTGPLRAEMPAIECNPAPETLATVRAIAGVPQEIFGVTRAITGHQIIDYQELRGSSCKATIRERESLSFNPFMYTKPGTYDDGTEVVPAGRPCRRGVQIPRRLKITELMAQKLRDGEAEHCKDHKLAFALSQSKFNRAIQDLAGEYCAAGRTGAKICEPEFAQRFKDRTGIDFTQQLTISQCLHDKTKLRDDPANGWHNVAIDYANDDRFYAPGCTEVTYIPSHAKMNHINAHSSSTIVKDCGEPA